ncbi:MAG: tetratricopeptide repeat protein [Pseudobdellovibrionaceae bacterium]
MSEDDKKRIAGKLSIRSSAGGAGFGADEERAAPAIRDRGNRSTVEFHVERHEERRGSRYTGNLNDMDGRDLISLPLVRIRAAQFLSDKGRFDEAESMLRDNIARMDDEIKIQLTALAKILVKAEKYADAEEALNQALEIDSEDPRTLASLGNLYKHTGDYGLAIEKFEEALSISPNDTYTLYDVGHTYLLSGQLQLAAAAFQAVVEIDPDDRSALRELGKLANMGIHAHPSNGG